MYTQYQRNHGSVSFFSFILYRFQRPYYQSTITWETGNSTTLVSLSRAIYFLQQSNRLSAFFCIVDNSEAFPYIVIKDEFSSPVEKTPQFSYDRLYFIMRWKDISAGEKKNPWTPLLTKGCQILYASVWSGSLWKECCCWVSDFPWSICILRTNNCEVMAKLFTESNSQWLKQKQILTNGLAHCLLLIQKSLNYSPDLHNKGIAGGWKNLLWHSWSLCGSRMFIINQFFFFLTVLV